MPNTESDEPMAFDVEHARIDTRLIHAGEPIPRIEGAVSMPVFQSANFEYAGGGRHQDIPYIRLSNTPNHKALHEKLVAPSLGGVETLLTLPAITSHGGLTPRDRRELGITDSLVRVAVGIEATEDLLEDFNQALQ